MTFLNPTLFAAGLACIAIPILIHLLMQRRRKPIAWGAMRFLIEAYKRQQRRLKLERWLLLLARCLLVAALAMAFGKPLVGQSLVGGQSRTLYILIDNSLTAQARGPAGSALDRHKVDARALIESLRAGGDGHRVGVITLGGPSEALVMPPSPDLSAVLAQIDRVTPTDSRADIAGALSRVAAEFAGAPAPAAPAAPATPAAADRFVPVAERTTVAVLSDLRRGSLSASGAEAPRPVRLPAGVRLLASRPALEPLGNIAITRVEPLRSVLVQGSGDASAGLVRITLSRSGEAAGASTAGERITALSAWLARPDQTSPPAARATASVRWAAGEETATAVVQLPDDAAAPAAPSEPRARSGTQVIIAAIDGGDAIAADDRWRRPIESRGSLRVGVAASSQFGASQRADQLSPGTWARLALAPTSEARGIDVVMIEPAAIDGARLAGLDALILPRPDLVSESAWSRVALFVESGGLLVVFPPGEAPVHLWPDAMNAALAASIGTEWSIPRESRTLAGEPAGTGARLEVPAQATPTGDDLDLLTLVGGELGDLVSAVRVRRVLPVVSTSGTVRPLLIAGGEPVVSLMNAPSPTAGATPASGAAPTGTPTEPVGGRRGGRGLVVVAGVALDLEWSDLPAKPLMVPLMQELVRQGVGRARGTYLAIAGDAPPAPARTVELRARGNDAPDASNDANADGTPAAIGRGGPIRRAGLLSAVDETGVERALVAVNPDPRASDVGVEEPRAIAAWLTGADNAAAQGGAGATVVWLTDANPEPSDGPTGIGETVAAAAAFGAQAQSGPTTPIWTILLAVALAMGVIEMLLARAASHASVKTSGGGLTGAMAGVGGAGAGAGA